eukprot:COSAG01_NODE_15723_length_1306_cov_1.496272_2_plen_80_part_01
MFAQVARPRRSRLLHYGLKEGLSKLIKLDLFANSFILRFEKVSSVAAPSIFVLGSGMNLNNCLVSCLGWGIAFLFPGLVC